MELLFRHFWIAFVAVTVVNGRAWWNEAQRRIREQPDLEPGYRRLYRGYLFWLNLPWLAMGLGIVSGRVSAIHEYLRPGDGNPFVLAWWGLAASLLCLGTYWILLAGGAEELERHPGVAMVPRWPASKLRLFWIGVVAWNVAIGSVIALGFPWAPTDASTRSPSDFAWLWAVFPPLFAGMWMLVCFVLSITGGWHVLAARYATKVSFSGERFHFRSARVGGVNYGGCLTFGSGPAGLYLAILFPFRIGHPPLAIPWSDVSAREARRWLFHEVELYFANAPGVSLWISRGLADALLEASGAPIRIEPGA
jgi:hypothetical protein